MTDRTATAMRWNAFLSYSRDSDRIFAPVLRDALHRFAKPVFALRRTNVFLDAAALTPDPSLPARLRSALEQSEHLILLANPRSAASKWVAREVEHWVSSKGVSTMILVLTGGTITWGTGDFDWPSTDALPSVLKGCFIEEPLWLDATEFKDSRELGRHPDFIRLVSAIASVLLKRPLDELIGEDVASRQRLNMFRNGAIAGLSVLTVAAAGLGIMAELNRRAAVEAGTRALERALAVTAMSMMEGNPGLEASQTAAAISLQANRLAPSPQAWIAASRALTRLPNVLVERQAPIEAALLRPGLPQFAVVTRDGLVSLHALDGKEIWRKQLSEATAASWSPSGRNLAVAGTAGRVTILSTAGTSELEKVLDQTTGRQASASSDNDVKLLVFAGEARLLVVRRDALVVLDTGRGQARTHRVQTPVSTAVLCGNVVVWGDDDGQVWTVPVGLDQPRRAVHKHEGYVEALACAADGSSVASSGMDDVVRWTHGDSTHQSRHAGWSTVALSRSGRHLAVMSMEQGGSSFTQRDGSNETWLFSADAEAPIWHSTNAYQSDRAVFVGETLIATDEPQALNRVDPTNATKPDRLLLPYQVDFLAPVGTGESFLYVTSKGVVGVLDATNRYSRQLAQLPGMALTLDLSKDGTVAVMVANRNAAAAAGFRRVVALTRLDGLAGITDLPTLTSFAKDSDGSIVLAQEYPAAIARARFTSFGVHLMWRAKAGLERVALDPNTGTICVSGSDKSTTVLSRDGAVLWSDRGVRLVSEGAAFSSDSQYLALANDEIELDLRRVANGARVTPRHWAAVKSSIWQLSPDARFVAMVADYRNVRLLSYQDTTPLLDYRPNNSFSMAFAPDGRWFAGVDDANMLVWIDLESRLQRRFPLKLTPTRHNLATISNGTSLILIGGDGVSRIDLPGSASPGHETVLSSGRPVEELLALSADDKLLAVAMADNSVVVVPTRGGQVMWSTSFGQHPTSGVFDAAGTKLALASVDGAIRIYDLIARKLLVDLPTSLGVIGKLAFVESDRWLLAEGQSGGIVVRIDPFEELCQRAGKGLDQESWSAVGGRGVPETICPGW